MIRSLARLIVPLVACCFGLTSCFGTLPGGDAIGGNPEDARTVFPVDSGNGFALAIVEKYSLDPVAVVEIPHVATGEISEKRVVSNAQHPSRHANGTILQTERCANPDSLFKDYIYSYIAAVDPDGSSRAVTPCSAEFLEEPSAPKLDFAQLSPNGRRVVAHFTRYGEPTDVMVFEEGQLIERLEGYFASSWIDDNTLALIGSRLARWELGSEPQLITDQFTSTPDGLAVSPDGRQIAVAHERALWVLDVDGSNLREVLPAEGYVYPAWSPDGQFVAALQQEAPTASDGRLVGDPNLVGGLYWNYTYEPWLAIVHVETGERSYAGLSNYLTEDQMPFGQLAWY